MNRRHGHIPLALLLGLLAPSGCARWQYIRLTDDRRRRQSAAVSSGELSTAQAAQLCLTAGEALEKKGFTAEALQQYENARSIIRRRGPSPGTWPFSTICKAIRRAPRRNTSWPCRSKPAMPNCSTTSATFTIAIIIFRLRRIGCATPSRLIRIAHCAWINLGQVLARQGRTEESYQAFAHALRPAEAYSNLGVLLAKQGRTAEARRALQEAVTLDPRLEQPRAFLNALPPTPALLPPTIRHSAAPARPKAAMPTVSSPPPPVNLPRKTQTPGTVRNTPPTMPRLHHALHVAVAIAGRCRRGRGPSNHRQWADSADADS